MRAEFIERNSREWDLAWEHLMRVLPDTDLADNFAGETWEYMGTWYSNLATHDNRGVPIPDSARIAAAAAWERERSCSVAQRSSASRS